MKGSVIEMEIIGVSVADKIATADGTIYVCDNTDYVIDFTFDEEWAENPAKTARFAYGRNKVQDIVFEGTRVAVPRFSGITRFQVGVFAGDLRTTTAAVVQCRKSILDEDGSPDAPTEDVYAQIMDMLNQMFAVYGPENVQGAINAALEAAKLSGEFDGPPGEPGKDGTVSFDELTESQKESLKGEPGYTPKKGVDYFDGKNGVTPDIQIGTVTTLATGQSATATITGTAEKPVLNLGLPKGTAGDSGALKKQTFASGATLTLADNTAYTASGAVTSLTIQYPSGNFDAAVYFTTAASGTVMITLPEASMHIGDEPTFGNGETWELSIRNGIVAGGKAE